MGFAIEIRQISYYRSEQGENEIQESIAVDPLRSNFDSPVVCAEEVVTLHFPQFVKIKKEDF